LTPLRHGVGHRADKPSAHPRMLRRRACFATACALLLRAVGAGFAPTCDAAAVQPALPGVRFERCALLRGRSADAPALRMLWRVHGGNVTVGVHVDGCACS